MATIDPRMVPVHATREFEEKYLQKPRTATEVSMQPDPKQVMEEATRFTKQYVNELAAEVLSIKSGNPYRPYSAGALTHLHRMLAPIAPSNAHVLAEAMITTAALEHAALAYLSRRGMVRSF